MSDLTEHLRGLRDTWDERHSRAWELAAVLTMQAHLSEIEILARSCAHLLSASVGRNPEGQDRETGLGRNDEHAVGATGAETPNHGSTPETGLVEALNLARNRLRAAAINEAPTGGARYYEYSEWADEADRAIASLSNVLPDEV